MTTLKERLEDAFGNGDGSIVGQTRHVLSFIEKEVAEAVKAEHDHWANQPMNDHDEKIRQAERERILAAIDSPGFNPFEHIRLKQGFSEACSVIRRIIENKDV